MQQCLEARASQCIFFSFVSAGWTHLSVIRKPIPAGAVACDALVSDLVSQFLQMHHCWRVQLPGCQCGADCQTKLPPSDPASLHKSSMLQFLCHVVSQQLKRSFCLSCLVSGIICCTSSGQFMHLSWQTLKNGVQSQPCIAHTSFGFCG